MTTRFSAVTRSGGIWRAWPFADSIVAQYAKHKTNNIFSFQVARDIRDLFKA